MFILKRISQIERSVKTPIHKPKTLGPNVFAIYVVTKKLIIETIKSLPNTPITLSEKRLLNIYNLSATKILSTKKASALSYLFFYY